jgi:hypothetical protein
MADPLARRRVLRSAAGAMAVLLAGCSRADPERELRETIAAMAHAVEARDPGTFLAALTEDFTRESGAFGKPDAKRVLAGVYLRNEKIRLAAVVTDVTIDGDGERARARVRVVATGASSAAGLLPERGQTWEFDTAWRRDGGRWKVFNAEWREGL